MRGKQAPSWKNTDIKFWNTITDAVREKWTL